MCVLKKLTSLIPNFVFWNSIKYNLKFRLRSFPLFSLYSCDSDKMWSAEKGKSNAERKRSKAGRNGAEKEKIKPIRSEREVGILLNLTKHDKFDAVIKQRYSDFHVNEIDLNGRIVHLTSYDLPKDVREKVDETDPIFCKWLNEDTRSRIQTLHETENETLADRKDKSVEINVTDTSKEVRTKIHRWLSTYDKLVSETIEKVGQKLIVVSIQRSKDKRFARRPANRGKFTYCVLYKEGIDTTDAISYLARKLKMRPNHISFAGTKDKQAKTTQRVCFSNIDASRLVELNKYSTQSRLGNFEYHAHKLNLGDLSGNHFKLLLKNVLSDSDSVIHSAIESLRTQGFINYFGLQRFGSYAVPTHLIGKAIIQMKYDEVFDLILEPKSNDPAFMSAAKNIWFTTRNAEEAVKLVPSWCRSIEQYLFTGLSKYYVKRDYTSALACIPRNMRLLYLHAYQSYTWNRVASYRIKEYGLVPVVGDLVYVDPYEVEISVDIPDDSVGAEGDGHFEETLPTCNVPFENTTNTDLSRSGKIPEVKHLNSEDLANYTIYDIIIPLQGKDIKYPKNKVKDYFEQLLLDGIGTECLQKFQTRPDTPKGAYRKLVVVPKDVSYKLIPYSDLDELDAFIPSDLDLLENSETKVIDLLDSNDLVLRDKKCILLELSLPTSSYATMALREILRGEEPIQNPVDLDPPSEIQNIEDEESERIAETEKVDVNVDLVDEEGIGIKKPRIELTNVEKVRT